MRVSSLSPTEEAVLKVLAIKPLLRRQLGVALPTIPEWVLYDVLNALKRRSLVVRFGPMRMSLWGLPGAEKTAATLKAHSPTTHVPAPPPAPATTSWWIAPDVQTNRAAFDAEASKHQPRQRAQHRPRPE